MGVRGRRFYAAKAPKRVENFAWTLRRGCKRRNRVAKSPSKSVAPFPLAPGRGGLFLQNHHRARGFVEADHAAGVLGERERRVFHLPLARLAAELSRELGQH